MPELIIIRTDLAGLPLAIQQADRLWIETLPADDGTTHGVYVRVVDVPVDANPLDEAPQIGSEHGEWSCRDLRCGVLTYAAEWCPGCGGSHRCPARDGGDEQ